jgi:hypothetical protein
MPRPEESYASGFHFQKFSEATQATFAHATAIKVKRPLTSRNLIGLHRRTFARYSVQIVAVTACEVGCLPLTARIANTRFRPLVAGYLRSALLITAEPQILFRTAFPKSTDASASVIAYWITVEL